MTNVTVTEDAVTVVASTDPVQVKAGGQAAVDAHNQDADAHPDLAALSGDVVVVKHAADSTVARPSGANVVHWYGTVAPSNAATDDVWVDNTNDAPRLLRFDGTAFDEIGSASSSAGVTRLMQAGYVYLPETGNSNVQNTGIGSTNGYSYTIPIWLPNITIATIGVYVAAAASATTYDARLGVYRSNAGGIPDALLADAGTVSLLTTGAKSAAVNVAVDAGLYWLTFAIQNVTGFVSAPQLTGLQQTNYSEIPVANFGSFRFSRGFIYAPDLTGALPATYPFVIDSFGQTTPLIGVGV